MADKKVVVEEIPNDPKDPQTPDPATPPSPQPVSREELDRLRSEMAQMAEINKGLAVVVNTIASDPELKRQFQAKVAGVPGQQQAQTATTASTSSNDGGQNPVTDKRVDDVVAAQRFSAIKKFEERYGIANLPEEQAKETRKKIADHLSSWGWDIESIPVSRLEESLDKAYVGTHAEKLREEGKLEGIAQYRQNQQGMMSQISGTAPNASGQEAELTPKQKEWVKKLHVDEEKAKETYINRENEENRIKKGEVQE